jgi:hypothetical protein
MPEKKIATTNKEEIQQLGLRAIAEFFQIDISKLSNEDRKFLHEKAKIGMQFEREMNLTKRAVEMNYLRVFKLYAADKKELRSLIKKSLSQYLPK